MSLRLWEEGPGRHLWEAECGCWSRVLGVMWMEHGSGEETASGRLQDLAHFLSQAGSWEPHVLTGSEYPGRFILIAENRTESFV